MRRLSLICIAVITFATLVSGPKTHALPGTSEIDAHARALKLRLPAEFTVIAQSPFVVIGDESPERVKTRARGTVQWTVDQIKQEYFAKDPEEIIDVWLFKDKESYERNTRKYFGDTPDTPYGYYSERHRALIMNVGTGGGTLVHEIVHPFMHANFPNCPPWFNEGLASLYEQCGEVGGRIHGFTNWRLAGLQEALGEGRVPAFKKLFAMDYEAFYNKDKGTNYAQARYLCYYLQEKGMLKRFYHEFVKRQKPDPTGIGTLQQVLGYSNATKFQASWSDYVRKLRYP
jgi:hypothetical protein